MTLADLRTTIAAKHASGQPAWNEEVELQRKFSIPFACLVFALVGIPLGIQPVRAVRSRGFALSLALTFCYYLFLSAGETIAKRGLLPAAPALWLPNMALGSLGIYLFVRATREVNPGR